MKESKDWEKEANSYLTTKKLPKRALYIITVAAWVPTFISQFESCKEELNLKDEDLEPIVDWILTDALAKSLKDNNVRVIGHYRNDEAKAIQSAVPYVKIHGLIEAYFKSKFSHIHDTDVKAMVSGSEMIVAVRYN